MYDTILANLNKAVQHLKFALADYEVHKDEIKKSKMSDLLRAYAEMALAHDDVESARKAMNVEIEHLGKAVLPERFTEEKQGSTVVETSRGKYRMTVGYRTSATMLDKEKGLQWLKDNGHGGIVVEQVNPQTLSSFSKEYLETEGRDLPTEIFKVGNAPYTSKTRVNK